MKQVEKTAIPKSRSDEALLASHRKTLASQEDTVDVSNPAANVCTGSAPKSSVACGWARLAIAATTTSCS
jgi:hypothetical protein